MNGCSIRKQALGPFPQGGGDYGREDVVEIKEG